MTGRANTLGIVETDKSNFEPKPEILDLTTGCTSPNFESLAALTEVDGRALQHRQEIEGLRALAVLPVVLFHAEASGFGGGFAGVDVFFVISGYLITLSILRDKAEGSFSFASFYERRARRLLPAIFPVLATSLALAWLVMIPADFRKFSQALAASAAFAANMLFARRTGYFDDDEGYGPLLHLWSLSAEEQFYIVFPLLVVALVTLESKWQWRWLLAAAFGVMALASLALAISLWPAHQSLAFFLLPTRAWELLAGALCAVIPTGRPSPLRAMTGLGLIVGGLGLAQPGANLGWAVMLPVVGTALVLRDATPQNMAGKLLTFGPLPAIGAASYGIYLWHNPLLATLDYVWLHQPPAWLIAAVIALSVLLGFASLAWIEQPVRKGHILPNRRGLALCCGAGLLVALALGATGHLRVILPRSISASEALASVAPPGEHESVMIPPRDQDIDFVVVGDSHARQYFPALQQRLGSGALLTVPGCLSLLQATSRDEQSDMAQTCAGQAAALVALVKDRQIGTVIWAQRWERELFEQGSLRPLGSSSYNGWAALREGIVLLRAALPATTRLVIVGNVPTSKSAGFAMDGGYLRCLAFIDTTCPASFPAQMAEGHIINPKLGEVASKLHATQFFDPAKVLCDDQGCALIRQGKAIYVDWTHLTEYAADMVVEELAPKVARPTHPVPAPLPLAMMRPVP